MKILYAASEVFPFVKTGGLADVAGSLPQALSSRGADVRVILPLYSFIGEQWRRQMRFLFHTRVSLAWRKQYCGLFSLEKDGVTYYFVDNEYYFKRPAVYGFFDEAERFAFFSRAVIELLPRLDWSPDIISCNDWQTAAIPIYLRLERAEEYNRVKSVFTIHNIEYQGKYGVETLTDVFGLPYELFHSGILAYDDHINLMKGAIYFSDLLTTVSPTYSQELRDPYHAHGLHRVILDNAFKLRGILNGIDYSLYDPDSGKGIHSKFSAEHPGGKSRNKLKLQAELGLEPNADVPIITCLSRLVEHKGLDLVCDVFDRFMDRNTQFILMGTGDARFEQFFSQAAERYPGRVSANIKYDEALALRIYAGSDIFLMPSRSEPCGLSQMIAMRYGTVPVVRETGGLRDSVIPYPGEGSNGFSFTYYSLEDMLYVLNRAISLWYEDQQEWQGLLIRAMASDFSWNRSAAEYIDAYTQLIN